MVLLRWLFALFALAAPALVNSWTPRLATPTASFERARSGPAATSTTRTTLLKATDADDLQDQARKLREEINSFEQQKLDQVENEKRVQREAKMAEQKAKDYYCAVLPILKPDGSTMNEKVEFTPVSKKQDTCICVLEGALPLGMILEEGELAGTVVVDQIAPDSNAALAGVQVGDILRACTACEMSMEAPTWQLLGGGIGMPKTKRIMYVVDRRPFEEVMEAVASNRMDPEGRSALLVVERKRQ